MTWADALVIATLLVAFWGGYRAGFISEIIDLAAIAAAWLAAGALAGTVAAGIGAQWRLGPGVAHLIAFWLLFLVVFVAVRALGWLLERFARLPLVSIASGLGGGLAAAAKAVLLLWLILFVALFFPISLDVREVLGRSPTIRTIELLNLPVEAFIDQSLPAFARPVSREILKHHHL